MRNEPQERVKTDILIIGAGLAGCFAAMKAMEHGVKVTLIDKGAVADTGSNAGGIDHFPYCYIPEVHGRLGYKVEDFIEAHISMANGVIDEELCEIMWRDSYDRLLDLENVGVKVRFDKIYPWNFGVDPGDYPDEPKFRVVPWHGFPVPPALNIEGRGIKAKLDAKLRELGVNILNYYNAQDLLTTDGNVVGAIGFNIKTGSFFLIEAKATVLATGFLTRLFPTPVMFNRLQPPNQTGEGQTMAFRAGAELAVMELYPWFGQRVLLGNHKLKNWLRSAPATPSGYPAGRIVNAAGEEMPDKSRSFDHSFDEEIVERQAEWVRKSIKEGKQPFYWDATMATEDERKYAEWSSAQEGGGAGLFLHLEQDLNADLSTHQIELGKPVIVKPGKSVGLALTSPSGIIINKEMASSLKGLYAAGEVAYGQHFPSSPWAYATGARAGHSAAEFALGVPEVQIDEKQVKAKIDRIYAPLRVEAAKRIPVTWRQMNEEISNIMASYFRPSPYTLNMGLQYLEDLKKEKLKADNPHELMRSMETLSLLTAAEIFFRAISVHRKPDEWRVLRNVNGKMEFTTRPIKKGEQANG